jgi:hypothetical protein
MRNETRSTSRTTIRDRSGVNVGVALRGGSRTVVRSARNNDGVVIRRKNARRYVYSEPSTTVIRKKRYTTYRGPSHGVIVNKRRTGVVMENGVSTRTTVRSRTDSGSTVRASGNSRQSTGSTDQVRERSSGQNSGGAASSTEGRSGQSGRGSTPSNGAAPSTGNTGPQSSGSGQPSSR